MRTGLRVPRRIWYLSHKKAQKHKVDLMPFDLSIIIVNWNGGRLLTRCIETVVSSAPKATYEIVIVDNASTDDSLAELRANEIAAPMITSGQIRFILNSENRGF